MITIKHKQYCIDINDYADKYMQQLRQSAKRATTYVDAPYLNDILGELGSFSALIRQECLSDMHLMHADIKAARAVKQDYESFGDYCFEMLTEAYDRTIDCIATCNDLYYKLSNLMSTDGQDIAVASNFIGINTFGKTCLLELTNFRRMSGVGLCYDINVKTATVHTTNLQEQFQSRLSELVHVSDMLQELHGGTQVYNAIDEWSALVNDQWSNAKKLAEPAFYATAQTYRQAWQNIELSKQNASIFCILNCSKKITEVLHKGVRIKKLDYGNDIMQVLRLDYLNNQNFIFEK